MFKERGVRPGAGKRPRGPRRSCWCRRCGRLEFPALDDRHGINRPAQKRGRAGASPSVCHHPRRRPAPGRLSNRVRVPSSRRRRRSQIRLSGGVLPSQSSLVADKRRLPNVVVGSQAQKRLQLRPAWTPRKSTLKWLSHSAANATMEILGQAQSSSQKTRASASMSKVVQSGLVRSTSRLFCMRISAL